MPRDPLNPSRCSELLSALAAPERLKIVRFLVDGPRNVTEIADMLDVPPVNVSHHLNVLKNAKIIDRTKQGRFMLYSLHPGILDEVSEAGLPKFNLGCCRLEIPCPANEKR